MLAIRLQRIGRKKLPVYRVAIQEAHRHPSSGRVVTYVGSYDPHTKATTLDKEKVATYLKNGAQPSPRVVRLLKEQKIALPSWVKEPADKKRTIRNPEKLRKNNQPEEEAASAAPEATQPEATEAQTEDSAEEKSEE